MFPIEKFRNIKTPFYYYNPALLTETLDCINREIASDDQVYHVHYAVKANSNPAILKMIAAAGLGADCVSGGEVRAAVKAVTDNKQVAEKFKQHWMPVSHLIKLCMPV